MNVPAPIPGGTDPLHEPPSVLVPIDTFPITHHSSRITIHFFQLSGISTYFRTTTAYAFFPARFTSRHFASPSGFEETSSRSSNTTRPSEPVTRRSCDPRIVGSSTNECAGSVNVLPRMETS